MKILHSLLMIILVLSFSFNVSANSDVSFVWDSPPLSENVEGWYLYSQKGTDIPTFETILALDIDINNPLYVKLDVVNGSWSFWLIAYNQFGESLPTEKIYLNATAPSTPSNFKISNISIKIRQ
jgi:hypothetical protein